MLGMGCFLLFGCCVVELKNLDYLENMNESNGLDSFEAKKIKKENVEEDTKSHEDEDEDPVVHEIPMFLSKSLAKNLYLLQVIYFYF